MSSTVSEVLLRSQRKWERQLDSKRGLRADVRRKGSSDYGSGGRDILNNGGISTMALSQSPASSSSQFLPWACS